MIHLPHFLALPSGLNFLKMREIRVVLADDHTLVRQGVSSLLDAAPGICVVGEAANGRALLNEVKVQKPDVALIDVSMPLLNGLDATRRIRKLSPQTRVVILSMFSDKGYIAQARRYGAWGYVFKDEAPESLIDAVTSVASGRRYFSDDADETPAAVRERLTPREREVLQLIAEGKRNSEIAAIMVRSLHTVRNHRARLMRKLGAHTALELVQAAEEMGLVRLSPPGG